MQLLQWALWCVLHLTLVMVAARRRRATQNKQYWKYEDCGSTVGRPIRIVNITARPMPIRTPGRVKLSGEIDITHPLPQTIGVDVAISKYIFGIPFKIPCFKNLGTCHYKDVCALLEAYFGGHKCPRRLRRFGIPCKCPFNQGAYKMGVLRFDMPAFEGFMRFIVKGKYEASIRAYDETDKRELGCVKVTFHMKKQRKRKLKYFDMYPDDVTFG